MRGRAAPGRMATSHFIIRLRIIVATTIALLVVTPVASVAQVQETPVGIVIMHGKGGSPNRFVIELANGLKEKGLLVANLEMPWSRARDYDVEVDSADKQVTEAIASLRQQGARKIFVSGHSQGGVYAMSYASRQAVDGVIPIAPGGFVNSLIFQQKLGDSLAEARRLVAEGKGAEKARLMDFEGAKGSYPVVSPPGAYVTWFDPNGAMSSAVIRQVRASTPTLLIVPTRDYPALLKSSQSVFDGLPAHPLKRFFQPDADHLGAPVASIEEIATWTRAVAAQ